MTNYKKAIIFLLLVSIITVSIFFFKNFNLVNTDQVIKFQKISEPISNPMIGWAPWATLQQINQPHTLVYADLTWREFEPAEGKYDFRRFEETRRLTYWRANGQRVVFRFVADQPGSDVHLDIPDWLFEKMDGDGEFYDNEYGMGFSPNYANPVFLKYHQLAIKALGQRYGQDDFIAFIELGSLGHWGEWHTHPALEHLPPADIRDRYVMHYREAFPQTQLLMRRPFSIARKLNLGLYNDMTADYDATTEWLNWIANGGDYLPEEPDSLVPMSDAWKKAPIGGEQPPSLSNDQVYGADLEQTLQLLQESHATFIGPGSPYDVDPGGPLQSGLDRVLTTIGYRIYLDQVRMPRLVRYGRNIKITFTFSNDGIAPMYYNWPTRLLLFDENGDMIQTYTLDVDLRQILPGQLRDVDTVVPVGFLTNGSYSIGVAILDPLTDLPAVEFANENLREDLIQDVGSFDVNWLFKIDSWN